jgi:hypothetical protein
VDKRQEGPLPYSLPQAFAQNQFNKDACPADDMLAKHHFSVGTIRISGFLLIGVSVVLISSAIGVLLGLIAGY